MIRITETEVHGFRAALRGMRNPMESWSKSDTVLDLPPANLDELGRESQLFSWSRVGIIAREWPRIGMEDLKLMQKLTVGGTEHRKFLRQIKIDCVIEAPRYLWQEIDTYKVATVRDSCSTMHKLGHRDLVPGDFSEEDVMPEVLLKLNSLGNLYRAGGMKDYDLVRKMKRYLPEGYIQRADYSMNYETATAMFRQRKDHRLPEWRWTGGTKIVGEKQSICDWIFSLPCMPFLLESCKKPSSD